ncbi:MAG: flagellar hook-associated family protein [Hyphomicrobiales bacterium]|nr:flagellar hook-associated family protein [Hyphomicrobiales bacterium]
MRAAIAKTQRDLATVGAELSSGRLDNIGRTLGGGVGAAFDFRAAAANANAYAQNCQNAGDSLSAAQAAMGSITSVAQSLQQSLTQGMSGSSAPSALQTQAQQALSLIAGQLNASYAGAAIFGGANTGRAPVADYTQASGASARAATAAAFSAAFGVAQGAAGSSSITGAAMQSFLTGPFAALFSGSSWNANWSSADNGGVNVATGDGQTTNVALSANNTAFRDIMQAAAMVADTGISTLNADARSAVLQQASTLLGSGLGALAQLQSAVGSTQAQLSTQYTAQTTNANFLKAQTGKLENADPAQLSSSLALLTTQLELSYSLTNRISKLSLVNFI